MKFTSTRSSSRLTAVALLLSSTANAFHTPHYTKTIHTTTTTTATTSTKLNAFPTVDNAQEVMNSLSNTIQNFPTIASDISNNLHLTTPEQLSSAINNELLPTLLSSPWHLSVIGIFTLGAALNAFINSPDDYSEAPFEPGTNTYSPELASEFYSKRPGMVIKRILRLSTLTFGFNTGILFDWLVLGKLFKDEEYTALRNNEPRRAKEALMLCEQLGPTFIKLGQAVSIRTDLIPELYALELRQLQDAVPPFDSEEARTVLKRELGVTNLNQIFSELSETPVASASIGQVYRGKLAENGKDVAVKVQRPGILGEIALDLHVLRILSPIQTKLQNLVNGLSTSQEDIDLGIALVDEWGRGFVAETDYRLEAQNTIDFESAMRKRGLDAVCAPTVVEGLVRDKVLTTEWVEGTRLDKDASEDVPRLCGVAINAYLTMLLDTGVLHCDPHPGNLLRTTDGRLCILDWGMTLEVPDDLQYALLEFIAHINSENYDEIPQDFINLGFSPEDVSLERLQSSGITEGISFTFRQLSQGGGPKAMQERVKSEFQDRYGADLSDTELRDAARADMLVRMEEQLESEGVDVKGVTNVMEEMSKRNRELFALPPYVLYVARAFSTLEGIGLSIDEDYAIVQECYPYLARRLFTDKSPRAKAALRQMLGLSADAEIEPSHDMSPGLAAVKAGVDNVSEVNDKGLSPKKLLEMTDNFSSYTAATATVDRDGEGRSEAAKEFAKVLLGREGSTLQQILVEETAKLGDATTRSLLRRALVESALAKGVSSIAPKQMELVDELLRLSNEDEKILTTASELREVIGSRFEGTSLRNALAVNLSDGASIIPSTPEIPAGLQSIVSDADTRDFVVEQLTNVPSLGRRIGAGLFRRAAYRAMNSPVLPEDARKQLSDVNTRVADVLEPSISE